MMNEVCLSNIDYASRTLTKCSGRREVDGDKGISWLSRKAQKEEKNSSKMQ
jgi:hypothetical protein